MFADATTFNQDLGGRDVGKVTDMTDRFSGASAFSQNPGPWYIMTTLSINDDGTTLTILTIAAQNSVLDGHNPSDALAAGDPADPNFTITGKVLSISAVSAREGTFNVPISAADVPFGTDNTRTIEIELRNLEDLPLSLSGLDGEPGVTLDDVRIFYYAHAMPVVPGDGSSGGTHAARVQMLGPLTTDTEENVLRRLLRSANALSADLNEDGSTDIEDAAVLYYSFALEGSLGGGNTRPGIAAIKDALLGPLAGERDINDML